jgi:cytochrome d ubiquinol oxidase subunit I
MQHPVGYVLRNGRAEMTDFLAVLTNPTGWIQFGHQITSAYTVAAFFVLGISAWHLLRKNETDFFKRSFKQAALFGLVSTILVAAMGDVHAINTAKTQPVKFAAMESVWETTKAADMHMLLIPDVKNERNSLEAVTVPGMVSMLAFHDSKAEVKGLKDYPKEMRPPVLPVFLSFRSMVAIGTYLIAAAMIALFISRKSDLENHKFFLTMLVFTIPLPYLANQLGWVVAEMGRQPWIVYGVLKTADAVSKSVSTSQVAMSLAGFTALYGILGVIDFYLLAKYARKGPDNDLTEIIHTERRH